MDPKIRPQNWTRNQDLKTEPKNDPKTRPENDPNNLATELSQLPARVLAAKLTKLPICKSSESSTLLSGARTS